MDGVLVCRWLYMEGTRKGSMSKAVLAWKQMEGNSSGYRCRGCGLGPQEEEGTTEGRKEQQQAREWGP